MKHIQDFESFLNEGKDIVTFSIDDEKLDQLLHDNYGKKLDYVNVRGDEYYTLPRAEFDRFIDAAYSRGFDTDYEDSPDSVIYVHESTFNKSLNEGQSTEDAKTIMLNLKSKKDGIYVLKGGMERDGGWNPNSLEKGSPIYYTSDFRDPKLKSYQEDGMVWVDIEKGEINVKEY